MKKLLKISLILCMTTLAFGQFKPMMGTPIDISHPLSDFVAFWPMWEGSGNKVFDLSGNGNTGTLVADTHWVPGKFGSCLKFDGTGDYINTGTSPLYKANAIQISGSVWIYTSSNDFDGSYRTILDSSSLVPTNNDGFFLIVDDRDGSDSPINGITLATATVVGTATQELVNSLDNVITSAGWYHVAFTYDGSIGLIYVNGRDVTDHIVDDGSGNFTPRNANMAIGGGSDGSGNLFIGLIDLPMLYSRALSPSKIALLYREPLCMFAQDDIALMAQEAPPAGGGQFITIQMTACPVILFFVIYLRKKYRKAA